MRCLLLYYSLTGQAVRAVAAAQAACEAAGWDSISCRMDVADPAERPVRPLTMATAKKWTKGAQNGMVLPMAYEPAAAISQDYDLVLIFSNTWGHHPAVPVRSFLESAEAKQVLGGRKFGVFIICRRSWEKNLALVRGLGEAAGGNYVGGEAFTHPGSNLLSLIQTVTYIMGRGDGMKNILGLPMPKFGLSDTAMARLAPFTRSLLAQAS